MTFTVLARDPVSGLIGAATASRSLAAGNAVLALDPQVGVAATQAWTNRELRVLLLDELRAGTTAADAVALVPTWDAQPELRQVSALPLSGPGAARTGAGTTAWSGHRALANVVVSGNVLAGEAVLEAMLVAFAADDRGRDDDDDSGDDSAREGRAAAFADRLVTILTAGERAGGDVRGRQSAAVLVALMPHGESAGRAIVDLRVDDAPDPLTELARLVALRADDLQQKTAAR